MVANPVVSEKVETERPGEDLRGGGWIKDWEPNDPSFWATRGRKVARRNLVFSVFAEFLGFSVWQVFSIAAALLPTIGFAFGVNQLFWLAALPGLIGATSRFFYGFLVSVVGGRNWTIISTLLLLPSPVLLGFLVQDPTSPFWMFALAATLAGLGGGNFASSMANISYFYPDYKKGAALGLNAAGGNIGVSVVQLAIPPLVTIGTFGALFGASQTKTAEDGSTSQVWLQSAGFVFVPLILLACYCAYRYMNNLRVQKNSVRSQAVITKRKHTWLMSVLYTGTFGSFIGYAASFPLLIKTQFPSDVSLVAWAFVGPAVGSLVRPLGGWLSDRIGGARVTLWNFVVMIAAVIGVLFFLGIKEQPGAFAGFFLMYMVLFTTTGIGNGSTFRMIPVIYRTHHERLIESGENDSDTARRNGLKEAATALGFTSAIAAYGAFIIPKGYGSSIASTGGPQTALFCFIAFYTVCIGITWYYYARRGAEVEC